MKRLFLQFTFFPGCLPGCLLVMALSGVSGQEAAPTSGELEGVIPIGERRAIFEEDIRGFLQRESDLETRVFDEAAVVDLAIRNSLTVLLSTYRRVEDRQRYRVSRDEFVPDVNLFVSQESFEAVDSTLETDPFRVEDREESTRITPTLSWRLPTGGRFTASYGAVRNQLESNAGAIPNPGGGTPPLLEEAPEWESSWRVVLTQPLLRGGGIRVNTAGLKRAEIFEKQSLLQLETTLSNAIASALVRYRDLVAAERNIEIAWRSYERGLLLLERNLVQFAQGTMSSVEVEQAEAALARREISVLSAADDLDTAKLRLVRFLRLPIETPVETGDLQNPGALFDISITEARQTAQANREDLAISLLSLEAVELGLREARNNALWDLDLSTAVRSRSFGTPSRWSEANDRLFSGDATDVTLAATLSIPIFGDKTRRLDIINSKIDILRANELHNELYADLMTEVVNALRSLKVSHRQLEIARSATQLSRRSYEAELERQQAGLTSTFQVRQVEDSLLEAEAAEVDSTINYLNALTSLRISMGILPKTWNVSVDVIQGSAEDLETELDNENLGSLLLD